MMPNLVTFEECAASLGVPPSQVRTAVSQLGIPMAETENGPAFDRSQMPAVSGQLRRAAAAANFLAAASAPSSAPPPFLSGTLSGSTSPGVPEFSWARPLPSDPGSTPVDGFTLPGRRNGTSSSAAPSGVLPPWPQVSTPQSTSPLSGDTDINLADGDTDFMADLDGPAVDPALAFDDSPSTAGGGETSGSKIDVPNLGNFFTGEPTAGITSTSNPKPGNPSKGNPGTGNPNTDSSLGTPPGSSPGAHPTSIPSSGHTAPPGPGSGFPNFSAASTGSAGLASSNPPGNVGPGPSWSATSAVLPSSTRTPVSVASEIRAGESTSELSAERFAQSEESHEHGVGIDSLNRTDDGSDSSSDMSTRAIGIGIKATGTARPAGGPTPVAASTSGVAASVASLAANVAAQVGLSTVNAGNVEELVADPAVPTVLLVEPDEKLARSEQRLLTDRGLSAEIVTGRAGMLLALRRRDFDIVVLAHVPGPDDGPRLLAELIRLRPNVRAAVLTPVADYATVEEAARRFGAFCLIKSDRFLSTFADQIEQMLRSSVPSSATAKAAHPGAAGPNATGSTGTVSSSGSSSPAGPKPAGSPIPSSGSSPATSAVTAGSSVRAVPSSSPAVSATATPTAGTTGLTVKQREETGDLGDRAPVGLFRLDARGFILRANPRMAELLSFTSPTALVGRSLADLCNAPDALRGMLRDADSSPEAVESSARGQEMTWIRADGRPTRALVQLRRANRLSSPTPTYDGALLLATPLPSGAVPEQVSPAAWDAALSAITTRLETLQVAVADAMTAVRLLTREGPSALTKLGGFRPTAAVSANSNTPDSNTPDSNTPTAVSAGAKSPSVRSTETQLGDAATLDARQFADGGQLTVIPSPGTQNVSGLPVIELSAPSRARDTEGSMEVLLNPTDSAETLPANTVAKVPGISGGPAISGSTSGSIMEATTVVAAVPLPQPGPLQVSPPVRAAVVDTVTAENRAAGTRFAAPVRTVSATHSSPESRGRPSSRTVEPVSASESPAMFVVTESPGRQHPGPSPKSHAATASNANHRPTTPAMPSGWTNPVMGSIAADLAPSAGFPMSSVQMTSSGPAVDASSSIPIDTPSGFGSVQMSNSGFFDASIMASAHSSGFSDSRSGKTDSDNEVLDLNALTRQAIWFAEPKIKSNGRPIEMIQKLGNCSLVRGNRVRLREVIAKLLLNAADQMPGGGKIFLSSGTMPKGVFVAVRNTGAGIPDHIRRRIFDDDFVPTEDWQRVLRECLTVMIKHNGKIGLLSEPGKGSTVTIRLPPAVTSASEDNTVLTRR